MPAERVGLLHTLLRVFSNPEMQCLQDQQPYVFEGASFCASRRLVLIGILLCDLPIKLSLPLTGATVLSTEQFLGQLVQFCPQELLPTLLEILEPDVHPTQCVFLEATVFLSNFFEIGTTAVHFALPIPCKFLALFSTHGTIHLQREALASSVPTERAIQGIFAILSNPSLSFITLLAAAARPRLESSCVFGPGSFHRA